MTETDTIMFDLDGTLVESGAGILNSIRFALSGVGHPIDPLMDLSWAVGPPLEESLAKLMGSNRDAEVKRATELYRQHYGRFGILETKLLPEISTALSTIEGFSRTKLLVVTTKREEFANRILDGVGVAHFFSAVYGSIEGGRSLPKNELIARALSAEQANPIHSLMVGDRSHDVFGAHSNGVRALGVLWGYGDRNELLHAGADKIIERPAELPEAICDLLGR